MIFKFTYLFAAFDFISMAFFIASAVIGFLLCWVMLKDKLNNLQAQYDNVKASMDRLIDEYAAYKKTIDRSLVEKEEELVKVNRLVEHNQNMSNPKLSEAYQSLEHKLNALTTENDKLKAEFQNHDHSNIIEKLKTELEAAHMKLKKKDALLMQAKSEAFPSSDPDEILAYQKVVNKLKKKIIELNKNAISVDTELLMAKNKKLKKKLKKIKKTQTANQRPQPERVEYVETLDVKKLMEMIESGTLIKRRKSKVLSKN